MHIQCVYACICHQFTCVTHSRTYARTHTHTHTHTQVVESIQKQEGLVSRIHTAHTAFEQETSAYSLSARDQKLRDLAAGYDAYMELTANLDEGTKFYNNLTELLLNKVQNKVSDFTFARKTEKDDLLK